MASYQMKDFCLFVDAKDRDTSMKKPDDIAAPFVMDKRQEPATYLKLNDGAAFIARFIAMGVDTGVIAQILISEYGTKIKDPAGEVQAVVALLGPYLDPRNFVRPYQAPKDHGGGKHLGTYDLDFRVNWFPIGGYKLPL
jgi:hypothetical protein